MAYEYTVAGNVTKANKRGLGTCCPRVKDNHSGSLKPVVDTVGGLAIGYATGGTAGAFTGANADWNNRQLHPSEYKKAEEYAEIVAKHLGISRDEALGRIVRHMLRTVDYETAKADDFRIDQAIISLIGANNLPKRDEHYYNPNYNAQYNQNYARDVDLGRQNAHSGKTPAEIKAYNKGVVTDIPKAFGNTLVGVYESAANLVNGEIFPQSAGYIPIERPFDYYHQDYGSALETLITIGGTALIGGAKTGAKNADNAAKVVGETTLTGGIDTVIDPNKFNYLFGKVTSNSHNAARSAQLSQTMKTLGVPAYGRNLLAEHFSKVTQESNNIVKTFSNSYGKFEIRESLFASPSGKFVKFETTYQVLPNGTRVFNTVIPKGGM